MSERLAAGGASTGAWVAQALLVWYASRGRDLPWRRSCDPYHIWVSEIMLQQTQVATVIPYYHRFLDRFPNIETLANADMDGVLSVWEGLGYYARARNLHAAARVVRERHGGRLPDTYEELLDLPGIGEYAAGAIASIAFGQDVPAIDSNVVRVISRLFDYDGDPQRAAGRKALRRLAQDLLPVGRSGDFNQAMMELGATLCTPKASHCGECPVSAQCLARELGTQAERPIRRRRPKPPLYDWAVALIERDGRLLLVRRVPVGLLGGLWELPGGRVHAGDASVESLTGHLREGLGTEIDEGPQLAVVRHAYTHFHIAVQVYRCTIRGEPRVSDPWDEHRWLSPAEMVGIGLSGVTNKILTQVSWSGSKLLL